LPKFGKKSQKIAIYPWMKWESSRCHFGWIENNQYCILTFTLPPKFNGNAHNLQPRSIHSDQRYTSFETVQN
jgi:hypothetical protein